MQGVDIPYFTLRIALGEAVNIAQLEGNAGFSSRGDSNIAYIEQVFHF